MREDYLIVSDWFKEYSYLLDMPFRKVKIHTDDHNINLKYKNYTKNGFKDFEVSIPIKFRIDDEFIYFLGLWCGDRSGGKRFGVCNQNKDIINFVEKFLIKYQQRVEKILYIKKGLKKPKVNYDKKFTFDKETNGWVLSVHSNNCVLASFFNYLKLNLAEFLSNIDNKYPFFAGLFDAEGNVSLYNKSFRWACHDKDFIKIYSKHLKMLNLYDKYDRCCLISYNTDEFYNNILTYMKQGEKKNLTEFMITGNGVRPYDYVRLLKYVISHPNRPAKDIAKALKKNKVYSELKLLVNFGHMEHKNYPYQFEVTQKGKDYLGVSTS